MGDNIGRKGGNEQGWHGKALAEVGVRSLLAWDSCPCAPTACGAETWGTAGRAVGCIRDTSLLVTGGPAMGTAGGTEKTASWHPPQGLAAPARQGRQEEASQAAML